MSEYLPQPVKLTNTWTDSNCFNRFNLADDFKVFIHTVRWPDLTSQYNRIRYLSHKQIVDTFSPLHGRAVCVRGHVILRLGHAQQPFIEPAGDVLQALDAVPRLT